MATTAKRLALVEKLMKKTGEPEINNLQYQASLLYALNYYNAEYDNKQKKAWFLAYFKKEAKFPTSEIHEREFRSAGTLCRMLALGNALEENEMTFIQNEFIRIKDLSRPDVVEVSVKKVNIQDLLEDKAKEFVADFNGILDEFVMDRKAIPDIDRLMKTPLTTPVANKVAQKIQRTLFELRAAAAGTDAYLNEGYSNFKKTDLKKLLAAYENLTERLNQLKKVVIRKARTPKAKPVGVIVAKMKFAPADDVLGLKSVSPTSIVGADELYCFNVKTRKMQVYKALDGMTLTVKGTTIMNYDMEKSGQKTVRKPETLAPLSDKGKRVYANFMKALTAKPIVPNGRINADTLLLATFK